MGLRSILDSYSSNLLLTSSGPQDKALLLGPPLLRQPLGLIVVEHVVHLRVGTTKVAVYHVKLECSVTICEMKVSLCEDFLFSPVSPQIGTTQ